MASNVLSKGFENIKIFTFDLPDENYKRRVNGFITGMKDSGFKAKSNTVMTGGMRGKRSLQEIGGKLVEELFASKDKVDAILCVNDFLAEGVIDWLNEHNIRNVNVTGYDNIMKHVSAGKGFSTVSIDFEKISLKALDIISGKIDKCPKIINIPPQIIERNFVK